MWYTRISRREFGRNETIQNIQPILIGRYSERKLTLAFSDRNQEFNTLRELRTMITGIYDLNGNTPLKILEQFHEKSIKMGTIENRFAYEASGAVQEIGLMLLTGSIPIEVVVSSNGYQFIADWLYGCSLVENIIREKSTLKKRTDNNTTLKYHRIHGEWLANFSYLYFQKQWEGKLLKVFNDYFLSKKIDPRKRELDIRKTETQIIPKYIMKKIDDLI